MNNKPKTKLLTISLLCCGRPDTTERCLKSLMPIREAIDSELQVIDTGCDKETRAVIEKYADEIFEFTWVKDFAAARNFQLDQANGKMFLYIDDDEFFLDVRNILDFFKNDDVEKYNLGGYYQRNYLDYDGKEYQDFEVIRMCKVTPETHFEGKVHEYIMPIEGNTIIMDAAAGHFGYIYETIEDNIKHSMRNLPLLKEMAEEQPDNLRWPYQIAQEYRAIHYDKDYRDICKEGYEKACAVEDNEHLRYRGSFICGLAEANFNLDDHDKVVEIYEKEAAKPDVMEMPLANLAMKAAGIYCQRKQDKECKQACEYYLKICNEIGDDKGMQFLQGGLFINDTFNQSNRNMIYCYLMVLGMRENDFSVLTHYYRKVKWNTEIVRISRGFVVTLLQKASEYGKKKEISAVLNKFFTNGGFRNLMEDEIDDVAYELTEQELKNLKAAYSGTQGEKELGLFLDIRLIERQLKDVEDVTDYGAATDILDRYSKLAIEWQKVHDSWLREESDEVILAKTTLLGNGLEQFLELADTDRVTSLNCFKNLFDVRWQMNGFLVKFSKLYSDRVKVLMAKEKDTAKFEEMYKLEEALLQQIADLDAAGKSDEAVATYTQLVEIIRSTYGVDSLHV
ncbi:glycosyltransferase [Pseudobutyrivibrio xylanivorans]|uniref:Glycosyl transferase family 2 n=1 Tax=Pseudobutyrivibrio xylanivorans TaxID=185007 RepID=A0A5P6VMW5_PSEXY|nr:glycosyltransferase [Pseudobutyrivibrio xylanivorans]QFJ54006.1 glycosyl transferase family 2 [Pseudobutyrivibrio xylanivorans]